MDKLDIIFLGITGLVGRYGLRHLYRLTKENESHLTWGVAGRNKESVREALEELERETGDGKIQDIPIFFADMEDQKSIENMVKSTKLVMNATGPLRKNGEVVIQACLKFKTHYVDVSAEPNFIEKIQLKYNDDAKRAGIWIVNTCGIDSIAYDMGILFLENQFDGVLNSVETYLRFGIDDASIPGPEYNISTWKSIVDLTANRKELNEIRAKANHKVPNLKPKLSSRIVPFRAKVDEGWAVPSLSADLSVMRRTQNYMYLEKEKRPIQIESYLMLKVAWHILLCGVSACLLGILANFNYGRQILLKYPQLFSAGAFSNEKPTLQKLESTWFRLTLVGRGWKNKLSNMEDRYFQKTDGRIVVRVKTRNQGYAGTSLCLVLAGIVLLTEPEKMPKRGGVFTPGAAFCDTTLIRQLDKNGVNFEVIENIDETMLCNNSSKL